MKQEFLLSNLEIEISGNSAQLLPTSKLSLKACLMAGLCLVYVGQSLSHHSGSMYLQLQITVGLT